MSQTLCSPAFPRIQIWKDYDEEAEKEVQPVEEGDPAALKVDYMDVIISDIRTATGLAFSVQKLNTPGITTLQSTSNKWEGDGV